MTPQRNLNKVPGQQYGLVQASWNMYVHEANKGLEKMGFAYTVHLICCFHYNIFEFSSASLEFLAVSIRFLVGAH